ncbi:MAG: hypothetical protein ASARMPREDX12_001525 [Alectoria sarmentosa]|nr:MAG: hypothetical protein ASARMPREDX12_001525 [Alectoria sarmentosa]
MRRIKKQGKSPLLDMPPELQSMIAKNLDAVSLCNLKLVCKGIDTWTKDSPKLSASEWEQYHSVFETYARKRRKLQTLGCSDCKKLLNKGLFSDAAVHKMLNKGRLCISCAIQKGSHDKKRNFMVEKREVFGCRGCQEAKPPGEEDTCLVDNARWFEDFPEIDTGSFVASRGGRWCHRCWKIVKNYRSLDKSP